MHKTWTIFLRELNAYFNSPIGYIYLIAFVLIYSFLFILPFFTYPRADMRPLFNLFPALFCALIPLITMRTWAEDRKENTIEMLLTLPMQPANLVLGKYLASLAFFLVVLASTATVPVMIVQLGGKADWGIIMSSYLGAILLGALFLSVGVFLSALVRDQIAAAILTVAVCFLLFLAGTNYAAEFFDSWIAGLGTSIKRLLGVTSHYEVLARGIIALPDVVYFLTWCAIFLALNGIYLEGRGRRNASMIFTLSMTICLGIGITVNSLIGDMASFRYDCTYGKIHSLSTATTDILKKLPVPAKVNFYITPQEEMPTEWQLLEQDVVSRLVEMKLATAGKFDYQVIPLSARKLLEKINQGDGDSLTVQDFKDPVQFIKRLRFSSDPVSAYLRSKLSADFQQILQNFQGQPSEGLQRMVAEEVTRIIQSETIFEPGRFAQVQLGEKTRKLLEKKPQGSELALVNRLLLEDAYPEDIKRGEEKSVERHLLEKGIQPFSVKFLQQDQESTKLIYSSVGIVYKAKKEEVIPAVTPQNMHELEYQIVSNVLRLSREKKPIVALIAPKEGANIPPYMRQLYMQMGKPLPQEEDPYQIVSQFLEQEGYEVKRIAFHKKEPLPEDCNAVLVINPRQLNERQKWELARALHSGKNVFLAVQSYTYNYNLDQNGLSLQRQEEKPEVNDWLKNYGVTVDDNTLMDVNHFPLRVSNPSNPLDQIFGGTQINLPNHIMLLQSNMNREVSITARSPQLPYLWGTSLELHEKKADLKLTTLLTTSGQAWKVPGTKQLEESDTQPPVNGAEYPLMVMLEGQFVDVYKDKPRPQWPKKQPEMGMPPEPEDDKDDQPEPPVTTVTAKPAKLVLVGCAQLFRKELIRNSLVLFSNCVEALALSGELINIRARGMSDVSINRPSDSQRQWWKIAHFILLPGVLWLAGIGRLALRYRRRKLYILQMQNEQ